MIKVQIGDSRRLIHGLKDKSIDCVITSPPYWGVRDYKTEPIIFDGLPDCGHEWEEHIISWHSGTNVGEKQQTIRGAFHNNQDSQSGFCSKCGAWRGQLGLEPTPELFIKHLLDFFDDIRLKLKDEGNVFVNLGDTYAGSGCGTNDYRTEASKSIQGIGKNAVLYKTNGIAQKFKGLPAKCLCMIPQRFAWGMIEHGWILRNEIIWAKPNHMPESVTDRLTKAHEVIYHFVKQGKYYYNLDAIREPNKVCGVTDKRPLGIVRSLGYQGKWQGNRQSETFGSPRARTQRKHDNTNHGGNGTGFRDHKGYYNGNGEPLFNSLGKNPGDVWEITLQPYPESHFAVFPLELVRRPIFAGCPVGGTVLTPSLALALLGNFAGITIETQSCLSLILNIRSSSKKEPCY